MDRIRKDYELFARSEHGIGSNKLDSYEKYMIPIPSLPFLGISTIYSMHV